MDCDPFALLGLPRRPWLDEADLKSAFLSRAKASHPDAPGGDEARFAALNAAQAALADPAARLQLLAGGAAAPAQPPDAALGFRVGGALREADSAAGRAGAARHPLEQALAAAETAQARKKIDALLEETGAAWEQALGSLREMDAAWPGVEPAALAALGAGFRFLARWRGQLRERALALSLQPPACSGRDAV